jgi:hypothetical protein
VKFSITKGGIYFLKQTTLLLSIAGVPGSGCIKRFSYAPSLVAARDPNKQS